MITGLRTIVYPVGDLEKGKAWYTKVLDKAPYFDQPFYVGFEVGGFELGLIPDGNPTSEGPVTYWGTADIFEEVRRIESLGGTLFDSVMDVGEGIKVATLLDPFGNRFGVIENPHFKIEDVR